MGERGISSVEYAMLPAMIAGGIIMSVDLLLESGAVAAAGHSQREGKRFLRLAAITVLALGSALCVGLDSGPAEAINASPHPIHETQPDGTEIVLFVRGNEHSHWEEDANGYTVLRHNGRYVYPRRNARSQLAPTSLEVGEADPRAPGRLEGSFGREGRWVERDVADAHSNWNFSSNGRRPLN